MLIDRDVMVLPVIKEPTLKLALLLFYVTLSYSVCISEPRGCSCRRVELRPSWIVKLGPSCKSHTFDSYMRVNMESQEVIIPSKLTLI